MPVDSEAAKAVLAKLQWFCGQVDGLGLDGVWRMRPLLNGQELMKLLGLSPGPQVKHHLDKMVEWQLQHPQATKQDAIQWVGSSSSSSSSGVLQED